MKHICTYALIVFISLVSSLSLQGQIMLSDTLTEFVFISELDDVPRVFQKDSIALQGANALSLVDAIRGSQALYLKDYGPGNIASLSIRGGTAQQLAVFWNGMPINSPTLGMTDISLLPIAFFNSAVLSPGSSSLLNGAGGLTGGLYINSSLNEKKNTVDLQYALTPYLGASWTQAIVSRSNGKVSWRTGLMFSSAENKFEYTEPGKADLIKERENASNRGAGLSNDVEIQLADNTDLKWSFHYLNQEREIASPIGIPSREESQQDEIFRKTISLNHRAKNLTHQLTAGVAIEHQQYTAPQQDILSGINTRRYHFRYQGAMQVNSSLLVSTRLQHDKSEGTIDDEIRRGIQENGLFLGVEQSLSDHTLFNGGMRVEMLNNQLNPMTASFGVEHRPWDSDFIKVRASASKNFRNPTLNDLYWPALGNPDLLAEEGNSVEGGVHFFPKEIKISLVYFQNYLTDQIVWTPNDEGVFRPQNLNRARNRGIESRIDIRSKVIKKFQLAYTYTDSEVKRSESNAYVRSLYQPEHLLNVSAWDNRGPFEIGCSMSFSSEVWTDYALSTSSILGHVLLIDTHINWSPNSDDDRFTVGLSMRNLMDKNYEYVKDRPIPGRYMQLNFKMYLYETN